MADHKLVDNTEREAQVSPFLLRLNEKMPNGSCPGNFDRSVQHVADTFLLFASSEEMG